MLRKPQKNRGNFFDASGSEGNDVNYRPRYETSALIDSIDSIAAMKADICLAAGIRTVFLPL